ncbi:phospholipase C [Mycobacteroides chelonae]|nr:phospholipase C [Mycobacteroides chelonae]
MAEGAGSRSPQDILRPFRFDSVRFNSQNAGGTPHDWESTQAMRNHGAWDRWISAKTAMTMGHFIREDIPFQYALADAYTICDQYFCSLLGPTTPNRLFQWSGTVDVDGRFGGPAVSNPPDHKPVFRWSTYPEELHKAGVPWKTYVNDEVGNDDVDHPLVGDYGDNPLWLFHQYHDALTAQDESVRGLALRGGLHEGWKPDSGRGQNPAYLLDSFIGDCRTGELPPVSYIVAPYGWSEHPEGSPNYGAHYVQTVINAINSNEQIRRSTALIINFDENDGYFDHVLPPTPEPGTPGEFVDGKPIGYGVRVPMIIVSPWTRGGWVNSQVADHTSVIRFLERFTGVQSENISEWRRAISGDLTSCFDFANPDYTIPQLPDTQSLVAESNRDRLRPPITSPAPGTVWQPRQESAPTRRKRPGAYLLDANVSKNDTTITVTMANNGRNAVSLSLFANSQSAFSPVHVTLLPGQRREWNWAGRVDDYDISLYGPDGFLRRFSAKGLRGQGVIVRTESTWSVQAPCVVILANRSAAPAAVTVNAFDYVDHTERCTLGGYEEQKITWPLDENGYYDLTVHTDEGLHHRYAGRIPSSL